jgi:hypothetical protein
MSNLERIVAAQQPDGAVKRNVRIVDIEVCNGRIRQRSAVQELTDGGVVRIVYCCLEVDAARTNGEVCLIGVSSITNGTIGRVITEVPEPDRTGNLCF